MTQRKNQRKTNGHAEPHDPTNGHAAAAAERDAIPVHRDPAASDDVTGAFVAGAAAPIAAAGANRDACAEAAQAEAHSTRSRETGTAPRPNGKSTNTTSRARKIPPGTEPLPLDGSAFVEAVHERVDLVKLEGRLLRSKDQKIVQRELADLRDLRYGKGAASCADEEAPQVIWDLPRPTRDSKASESLTCKGESDDDDKSTS